jgi:hypothetical protein
LVQPPASHPLADSIGGATEDRRREKFRARRSQAVGFADFAEAETFRRARPRRSATDAITGRMDRQAGRQVRPRGCQAVWRSRTNRRRVECGGSQLDWGAGRTKACVETNLRGGRGRLHVNRPVAKVGRWHCDAARSRRRRFTVPDQNGWNPSSRFTSPAMIEIFV